MSEQRHDDRQSGEPESWFDRLIHRFSGRPRETLRDDVAELLEEAGADDFSAAERTMLRNVLGLSQVRISDVMVPRADIQAVSSDATLGELLGLFRIAGHSRLPVYSESLDRPLGMVHIRDFLDYLASSAETNPEGGAAGLGGIDLAVTLAAANILRPVLFVPGSMPVIDLLVRMQAQRTHMALVIDEYGGTDGLVSIEDLVETVVGDIEDEHDETAQMIVRDDRGAYLADARASLEEVSELVGADLATGEDADDVDTIGGLVATLAGRVPRRGETVAGPKGFTFEILDADPRRLKRLRLVPPGLGGSDLPEGAAASR
ncbi:MAG: HlyC/CorC family transporter [Methylobacteriaceae bacterium]|nr:HlyC/CorC family transporter [Methylobacteriaceae bacterium]